MDGGSSGSLGITKVGVHLGAEISGVDLTQHLSEAVVAEIRAALMEHQVLIFRDQDISVEHQVAFGECFGELSVHPIAPHDDDVPELIVFDNDADNPAVFTDNWHSDETFREVPPMGTILRAIELPPVGGDTLFASMTAAYDGLSGWVKDAIETMDAFHDLKLFRLGIPNTDEGQEFEKSLNERFPKVLHPVVREHPETKARVLFTNPHFTLNIKGLTEVESQAMLSILYHQTELPEYQLRVKWAPNTVVFWDNRSTQHYAPHDYAERRFMNRVTIKGTRPYGPGCG